jgi:signal peptidase I
MTPPVADEKWGQIQAQQDIPTPTIESIPIPIVNPSPGSARPQFSHSVHHKEGIFPALQSLLHLIVIAIFIITFCVQPFRIPSESMESTLLVGDFLLVNKQVASSNADGSAGFLPSAAIHRGDIVVFHDPVDSTLHLVKRVIGLPGDHLRLHSGQVYINGRPLSEPYAVFRPAPPDNFRDNFPRLQSADPEIDSRWWIRMRSLIDNGELIIPTGNFFVMGDNRNDSEDSRYWGFVPREAIVGKPLLIYFSLQQNDTDDTATLTQQALADQRRHQPSKIDSFVDFARWGRTFQIVR